MKYSQKHPLTKTYVFFAFALLGLFLVVLSGVKLFQNDLIYITTGQEEQVDIEQAGNYYVLLDTKGKRYETSLEEVALLTQIDVIDNEEVIHSISMAYKKDTDTTYLSIEPLDYDKQIRSKEYLSFGKVTLEEGEYTFNSTVNTDSDEIGDIALLSTSYVNRIGLFSLSAIATILLGLYTFKSYRAYVNRPLSKYQMKHMKK